MINIRELSVGSYVQVWGDNQNWNTCLVIEILRDDKISVVMIDVWDGSSLYVIGKIYTFPITKVGGICITNTPLKELGFTEADERGWTLVYWFGIDIKLLYRHNKHKQSASFRFKTAFRKQYVSISCRYVHELQNIMRFLTGGELEFDYREIRENISGPAKY